MAEETREATVKANVEATEDKWGEENWKKVMMTILKDINISLAMLVDGGGNS